MANPEAMEKLRAVLDYIPEEAGRRLPGDPQEYYDALTRRLHRTVAVKSIVKRKVIIEQPVLEPEHEPDGPLWVPRAVVPQVEAPAALPLPAEPAPEPARTLAEALERAAPGSVEASSVVEATGPAPDPNDAAPSEDFFDVVRPAGGRADLQPVEPDVNLSEREWGSLESADVPEEVAEAPAVAGEPLAAADDDAFEEIVLPPETGAAAPATRFRPVPQERGVDERALRPPPGEAVSSEFEIAEEGEVTGPADFEVLAEEEVLLQGDQEPPYQVNDFTLYQRETRTKSGRLRTTYFFSAEPRVLDAEPSPLPEGYEVIVNETTGIPVIRKSEARWLPVIEIEGLGPVMAERLERVGVRTTKDLQRADLREVSKETGISERLLGNFRAMADLLQIEGIYPDQAAALVYAGVRGTKELLKEAPADLARRVNQAAKDHQLKLRGKMTASRVKTWQEQLKKDK